MGKLILKYGLVHFKSENSEYCKQNRLKELNTKLMKSRKNMNFGNGISFECFCTPHTITCSSTNPFFLKPINFLLYNDILFVNNVNHHNENCSQFNNTKNRIFKLRYDSSEQVKYLITICINSIVSLLTKNIN